MQSSEIVNRGPMSHRIFTGNDQIEVSKSPYAAYENSEEQEVVFKGKQVFVNIEKIILHAQMGNLKIKDDDNIDLEILKSLIELEFGTSRMITQYLYIKGIDISQKVIQKRLVYLSKIKAVSAYEFRSKDKQGNIRRSHTSVYFLDTASEFILKSQKIAIYPENLNGPLKSKSGVKEALSRNQLMLSYISMVKNIDFAKISPTYKLTTGETLIPDLLISFDNKGKSEYFFFEVVRSFAGWEKRLLEKQSLYKKFIEGFKPSKKIPNVPQLILVAEDDVHAFKIFKTMLMNDCMPENQQYIYTTDNRVISDRIHDNGLFVFKLQENNDVHLNIINPKILELV